MDNGCEKPEFVGVDEARLEMVSFIDNIVVDKDYKLDYDPDKKCVFVFETECVADSLAQYPIILTVGGNPCISLSISGNDSGRIIRQFKLSGKSDIFRFKFSQEIKIKRL